MWGYLAMTPRFPATGIGFTGSKQKSTVCQCPWLDKAANQQHDSLSSWVMTEWTCISSCEKHRSLLCYSPLSVFAALRSMDGAVVAVCPALAQLHWHFKEKGRWSTAQGASLPESVQRTLIWRELRKKVDNETNRKGKKTSSFFFILLMLMR